MAFGFQWHITTNCLNRCTHCYMYNDEYIHEDCNFADFMTMFDNINEFEQKYNVELPFYSLTGGSPLLNPDCEKIVEHLHKHNKIISFLDIPEMVTPKNIELMKSNNIKGYQVSIDGLPETHDKIRGKGSFDRTVQAIKNLYLNDIYPNIMFTLSQENKNELMPLCEFLDKTLDAFQFAFDFVVPMGNAADTKETYLSLEDANSILKSYYNFAITKSTGKKVYLLKPSKYRAYQYSEDDQEISMQYDYPVISGCHIGWDSVAILQNGDVLPCRRLPIVLGNLKKDTFEDIFLNSELLRKFRRFQQYQRQCGSCNYGKLCRGCPAISYALTGDCFEKFQLCDRHDNFKFDFNETIPKFDCTNEEELEYIKRSLKNTFAMTPRKIFSYYPNIKKLMKEQKLITSWEEKQNWVKKIRSECSVDELNLLQRFLKTNLYI